MENISEAKSDVIKGVIADGLVNCIVQKGYAQTKMIDVAEACDRSPPHIRYYFKNKESILAFEYERIVKQFEVAVKKLDRNSGEAWLRALAELIFSDHPKAQRSLLILMEAMLVMSRSPKMLEIKHRYDQEMLSAIEAQLTTLSLPEHVDPRSVARTLFDFLNGLMINIAVDPGDDGQDAIERFCAVANQLVK